MLGRRNSRNAARRRAKQQRMSGASGTGTRRTPPTAAQRKAANDARRRPTRQKSAAVAGPVPKKFLPVVGPTGRSAKVKQKKASQQAAKQMKGSQRGIKAAVKQLKQRKSTTPTAQQKQMAEARRASRTTTRRPKLTPAQIAAIRKRQKAAIDAGRVAKVSRPTKVTQAKSQSEIDAIRRKMTPAQIAQMKFSAQLTPAQRKQLTPAQRGDAKKAASDARRRPTRNTRTPNIDDLIRAAKRASGRTGSGTLEARIKGAKAMNKIKRDMRQPPKNVRRQTEAARGRMIDLAKKRRQALQERRRGFAAKLKANRDNSTRGRRGRRLDAKYRNR